MIIGKTPVLALPDKVTQSHLVLHLVGNLNFFIGVKLGGTDFTRDREAEFVLRDVPRADLILKLQQTLAMLEQVLPALGAADFAKSISPLEVDGKPMPTQHFLLHLYGHFNWHLGQIDYHRRLVVALQ